MPWAFTGTFASVTPPSSKVMVPTGIGPLGTSTWTLPVKVTCCPTTACGDDEATEADTPFTVWVNGLEADDSMRS